MPYINTEYLWRFGGPRKRAVGETTGALKGSAGAPILEPSYVTSEVTVDNEPLGAMTGSRRIREINVVNEFPWTTSPQDARADTPVIRLREMYVRANPMINQIANNLAIIGEGIADMSTGKGIDEITKNISDHSHMLTDITGNLRGGANLGILLKTLI